MAGHPLGAMLAFLTEERSATIWQECVLVILVATILDLPCVTAANWAGPIVVKAKDLLYQVVLAFLSLVSNRIIYCCL